MRRTKDEYIRQHIQYENLRRANRFFWGALFGVPVVMGLTEVFLKESLWYVGNSLIWLAVCEGLFLLLIITIHKHAAQPAKDHRYFLYGMWAIYLILSDILVFNLQDAVISQILMWCVTIVFVISYLSSGRGARMGLVLQSATAAGVIWFYRLGLDIIVYNVLLLAVCYVLESYAFLMYQQKTEDQWAIRIANQRSERDPMTGLLNRRGFEPKAAQMISQCRKRRSPIGILMIDIDNFKKYNDAFGHPEGDKCIIAVAAQVQWLTDETGGICARLGGEEFAVLIRNASEVDALQYAKRLKMAVEELKMQQADGNFYPYVTISIGMDYHQQIYNEDYERMYQTADQALYRAKKGGRNCIYMRETRVNSGVTRYFA